MILEVELGDGSVEQLVMPGTTAVSIGRDGSCDVVLPSPDVSRHHVALSFDNGSILLTDQSANGTFIGDHAELLHNSSREILPLTLFRVGPYGLRLKPQTEVTPHGADLAVTEPPERSGEHGSTGGASNPTASGATTEGGVPATLRREIQRKVISHLDLAKLDRSSLDDKAMRPLVREALTTVIRELRDKIPASTDVAALIDELINEALGLGPLEALLADDDVSEIMVVDPQTIFVERKGRIEHTGLRFTDNNAVRSCIERIVTPLGRRIDESSPMVDARLADGSRVNAVIPPLALRGPCITIRKFQKTPLTIDDLIRFGAMTDRMARFLVRSVAARKNIVISGGTGSGKTTLLNVLSGAIPHDERVVTIEDAAELNLPQEHVVSLEARPPNMEGKGAVTIRDLVKNALRMRPDRIVVGECRGGEALDMLQAMSTGHDGSMTTTHANSPHEALGRLETLALMSGLDLPSRAIREQLANSVHLIVQQARFSDGSRRVTSIAEVTGLDDHGALKHQEIFGFLRTGTEADGTVVGEFQASGTLPSYIDVLIARGLVDEGDYL